MPHVSEPTPILFHGVSSCTWKHGNSAEKGYVN